jgi:hypothetical protein
MRTVWNHINIKIVQNPVENARMLFASLALAIWDLDGVIAIVKIKLTYRFGEF